jgi:ABC-type transporter Mla MlaB component
MTTPVDLQTVDGTELVELLRQTREKLTSAEGEIPLDFAGVQRIDPPGLLALEELADGAEKIPAKIVLRGVNVSVYKVLKLARLTSRFSFAD